MVALAFGWAAAVCVITLHLPQIWRSVVQGRIEGVPAARAWVVIAVSLLWLGYGLYGGGVVQIVLNGTVLVLNVLLVARLVPSRRHALVGGGLSVVAAAGVLAVGEAYGRLPLGVVGAVAGTVIYVPQLLTLRRTHHVDGVSPASLWLQAVSGVCWIVYGGLRLEAVVVVPNLAVLATTAWSLVLLRERRATAPGGVVEPSPAWQAAPQLH
jgi:uncharacterized protein with PQ loop repeat